MAAREAPAGPAVGVLLAPLVVFVLPVLLGPAAISAAADPEAAPVPLDVEVRGEVAAPFERVRAVLLDLENFPRWFPAIGAWRILARDEQSALIYGRQSLPWPVSDRDYVVRYHWYQSATRVFHLVARSAGEAAAGSSVAEGLPAYDGVVRISRLHSEWRIEASGESTTVRYRYRGDQGGRLPDWVARMGWRSSTGLVIDGLVDEVARRGGER